jgi:hypothetical protein
MKTATNIQENAEDIYAEAQQINENRALEEEEYGKEEPESEAAEQTE